MYDFHGVRVPDGGCDSNVPIASIQIHEGPRAPPICLSVLRSKHSRDPNAFPKYRSSDRKIPELSSTPFRCWLRT